jgi:glyoxylase-like metal-dependent hydrolase (beta-lactamase superfamily II)
VKIYIPGKDIFEVGNVLIKSLHIPGHSPGQTAFQINNEKYQNKILYVADIGAHPYYGDFISKLQEYKKSIDFLEDIYLSDNYILVPAHGTIYGERDEEFFKRIRERITKNRKRIIKSLSKNEAKSIKELVEDGVMTPKEKQFEPIKGMYYLWDGGTIYQHLKELEEENRVLRIQGKDFLNQKFKLV